jgi:hypothetical protein
VATPSGTTGTITVITDADAFVVGDIGKVMWLNGGRGAITARDSATEVTVVLTSDLDNDEAAASGTWGFNTAVSSLSGLDHLEGQTVTLWGDQQDLSTATVTAGSVSLPQACSVAMAGMTYRSQWKSLKLSYGAQKGSALTMPKAIKGIGLLLHNCGAALQYGWAKGKGLSNTRLWPVKTRTDEAWGEPTRPFTGEKDLALDAGFSTDPRLVFDIDGPAPATIAGLVPRVDERDR